MEWVGCIRYKKFQNEFMAQTCALSAPVQPVLQWVSCSNETLPNASKHYETHTNMSSGSTGVDCVRSLWKIPRRLHSTNLCINCTCSTHLHQVSSSNEGLPNAPKQYETHQNMSLWSNGVDRVSSLRKISMRFPSTNLCMNCTSSTHFAPSFV